LDLAGEEERERKTELYKKQLHNFYSSSNIIRVTKPKWDKMRRHVAQWEGEKRN
jgi:Ca2+-dependent lipid-binding protein